jgi:hypothetical protein
MVIINGKQLSEGATRHYYLYALYNGQYCSSLLSVDRRTVHMAGFLSDMLTTVKFKTSISKSCTIELN